MTSGKNGFVMSETIRPSRRAQVSLAPKLRGPHMGRAGDKGDPPMAEADEMIYGFVDAAFVKTS